jgi:DNA-binding IclR family transcriptional regulator
MDKDHIIQSVDRALQIIEAFESGEKELSLSQIARELNLNKSTVFGLVNTLKNREYLEQNPENARYRLGIKFFQLGSIVEINMDIRDAAKPFLKLLSDKYKETVHLCLYVHNEAIYIDKVDGLGSMRMYSQLGKSAPLHCTGVGKAILAYLDERTIAKIINNQTFKAFTPNTITTPDALRTELTKIHQKGYSIDEEEIEIGLRCVAAPIFNRKGEVAGAVSVAGLAARLPEDVVQNIVEDVLKVSSLISERLGYSKN